MEKTVFDFIRELLAADGIPYHRIACPCADWDWLDFGLRTRVLGMSDLSKDLNRFFGILKANTVYHYMDVFQCHYTVFKLPSASESLSAEKAGVTPDAAQEYFVIGPILFEPIHGEQFEALFRKLQLPPRLAEPLCSHYQNIPTIPFASHYESIMSVLAGFLFGSSDYRIVFKSEGDLENLRFHYGGISRFPEQPFLNIEYIEERYRAENAILTAIGRGNEAQAMENVKKLINLGIPPRLANTLRDKKDLTITLNSLMRKAAEQAGVHPIHIDSFSNQSIKQIEQLESPEQCHSFQRKLALGYCRLVKKYSISGYSLPVQKAITYITTDLSADLGLKALAGKLNVTPSYLSSLFRKETGTTLTDYVNQQRIAHAQHLLLNTSFPIKSIAQQCGIADLNYFVRMFKRAVGVTPKFYRDTAAHSQQMEIIRNHEEKENLS